MTSEPEDQGQGERLNELYYGHCFFGGTCPVLIPATWRHTTESVQRVDNSFKIHSEHLQKIGERKITNKVGSLY